VDSDSILSYLDGTFEAKEEDVLPQEKSCSTDHSHDQSDAHGHSHDHKHSHGHDGHNHGSKASPQSAITKIARRQIECADVIVFNKQDLVSEEG